MKKSSINHQRLWRRLHYWGALACALPVAIMIVSGVLLLLKKDVEWIQPSTVKTESRTPSISFEQALKAASTVEQAGIKDFGDIDRFDVRPNKGVIKVRSQNGWEIQLHPETAEVLQASYRRSDIIEAIHDGSFFHDRAKLGLFLPASIILLGLLLTGMYLFALPFIARKKKQRRMLAKRYRTKPPVTQCDSKDTGAVSPRS